MRMKRSLCGEARSRVSKVKGESEAEALLLPDSTFAFYISNARRF
jgi:hypothetical protein